MKVNLGCGQAYLEGWVNVDEDPAVRADVYAGAFDFVRDHGPEVDEIYLGHFLEHLLPGSAVALLWLMQDRMRPGTMVSAVSPDMRAIFAAYIAGEITNSELNERFVYSYEQPSHHAWCHDTDSLTQVFREAGFLDIDEIDPLTWPPVYWKEGPESRWQCGVRAFVPESPTAPARPETALDETRSSEHPAGQPNAVSLPVSTNEMLLTRVRHLREEVGSSSTRSLEARSELDAVRASRSYALARRVSAWAERLAPRGSRRFLALRAAVQATRRPRRRIDWLRRTGPKPGLRATALSTSSYGLWRRTHDATDAELRREREVANRLANPVHVHCVVVAVESEDDLESTLASLDTQSWPHWAATIVGPSRPEDGAAAPRERPVAFRQSDAASLISVVNGIAAEQRGRDLLVFVEAGDCLAPDCLSRAALAVWDDPLVDLVYWDDDVLDHGRRRVAPRFRPSWSPETLLGADYIGRSFAVRQRRFVYAGGLRDGLGNATFWDLVLRCELDRTRVSRIPRVLEHLRGRVSEMPPTGTRVVTEHLERRAISANVQAQGDVQHVEYELGDAPHVSVIIPTRHNRPMLGRCLESLACTDYPSFGVVVVDNGDRVPENEDWYASRFDHLDLTVEWWTRPFNYSAVNNFGAGRARGEILIFLNDDTEMADPSWMRAMVGWAQQPEIGAVGVQLTGPAGEIQHGGAVLGLNGFADHLFQGMAPGSPSLLGPTTWYRNVLAVTGACLAIQRSLFEELGGFDERFDLCGSDVALGLDAVLAGKRNVCLPPVGVRHLESATRGSHVPREDFFASFWRYQRWIFGGDPYFSPNLSLESRKPALRPPFEPTPAERLAEVLGRPIEVFRQTADASEAAMLAGMCRSTDADARAIRALHELNRAPFAPRTVNWFLPGLDSPFYGGINTVLRMAEHLARTHGVENRFVVWGSPNEEYFRSGIAAAFPSLGSAGITSYENTTESLERVPEADVSIATLWATAYAVAQFPHTRRKFYVIQDFEPGFYPAGTLYALAEETYRLGLYGLCNTDRLLEIYEQKYGGHGTAFMPAVDPNVFHAEGRQLLAPDSPVTVFVYARPGHWRNCWELAEVALRELKGRLGDRVRIVTAGSWARPEDVGDGIRHLGLLDYRETGTLYRTCDVGVALTVSEHPSYLPLEFMACGVAVVAFDNPAGHWLLRDGQNCLLARRTVDALRDAIERLVLDPQLRQRVAAQGTRDIAAAHGSWEKALSGIHAFLSDPEGVAASV